MRDYRELAEKAIEAVENFDAHAYEGGKYELECPLCKGKGELLVGKGYTAGRDHCNECSASGVVWDDESIQRDRIAAAAEVLRSALTPVWTSTPEPLPEGAERGVYVALHEESGIMQSVLWDKFALASLPSHMKGTIWLGPLAAFNVDGEVVR